MTYKGDFHARILRSALQKLALSSEPGLHPLLFTDRHDNLLQICEQRLYSRVSEPALQIFPLLSEVGGKGSIVRHVCIKLFIKIQSYKYVRAFSVWTSCGRPWTRTRPSRGAEGSSRLRSGAGGQAPAGRPDESSGPEAGSGLLSDKVSNKSAAICPCESLPSTNVAPSTCIFQSFHSPK